MLARWCSWQCMSASPFRIECGTSTWLCQLDVWLQEIGTYSYASCTTWAVNDTFQIKLKATFAVYTDLNNPSDLQNKLNYNTLCYSELEYRVYFLVTWAPGSLSFHVTYFDQIPPLREAEVEFARWLQKTQPQDDTLRLHFRRSWPCLLS